MSTPIKIIMLAAFIIPILVAIISDYFPIFKDVIKSRKINSKSKIGNINEELNTLKSKATVEKKANAFVNLMRLSYVLIHTIVNKGNNYDDIVQMQRFKKSLTKENIEKLNALEGKHD